jgi:hypothetical protein
MANSLSIQNDTVATWVRYCRWGYCHTRTAFLDPDLFLDHLTWHIRGAWLCRFEGTVPSFAEPSLVCYLLTICSSVGCLAHFQFLADREAHHSNEHRGQEPPKSSVPPLKLLNGVSRRLESRPPELPERCFTWDRGWYVDVVANPSASTSTLDSANVVASEGVSTPLVLAVGLTGRMLYSISQVNSHPLVPMTPRRRTRDGAGARWQTELAAKDEYGFLVPYYPPDFVCEDLRVGLEVLERESGHGDELGDGRGDGRGDELGSPDELLLVGGRG